MHNLRNTIVNIMHTEFVKYYWNNIKVFPITLTYIQFIVYAVGYSYYNYESNVYICLTTKKILFYRKIKKDLIFNVCICIYFFGYFPFVAFVNRVTKLPLFSAASIIHSRKWWVTVCHRTSTEAQLCCYCIWIICRRLCHDPDTAVCWMPSQYYSICQVLCKIANINTQSYVLDMPMFSFNYN